jgi:hypothetical protein
VQLELLLQRLLELEGCFGDMLAPTPQYQQAMRDLSNTSSAAAVDKPPSPLRVSQMAAARRSGSLQRAPSAAALSQVADVMPPLSTDTLISTLRGSRSLPLLIKAPPTARVPVARGSVRYRQRTGVLVAPGNARKGLPGVIDVVASGASSGVACQAEQMATGVQG